MANLTKRETQIVALIAEGKNNVQIGLELGITAFTVGKHRSNISRKFDLHTTAQLVSFSVARSTLTADDQDAVRIGVFSEREKQILRELSLGRTSKEIARVLTISPRTVDKHIENIKGKSRAKGLASLMRIWTSISSSDKDDP